MDGMTFEAWQSAVNRALIRKCGLGIDDLPDQCYWDSWDAGVGVIEMAEDILESEGFYDMMED